MRPNDDYIVLVDYPQLGRRLTGRGNYLTSSAIPPDRLMLLRDAGARTCIQFIQWDRVEPAQGVYDWTTLDEQVARTTEAGLFPLVGVLTLPDWMPSDWLALPRGGERERWRQRRPDPWDSKFLSLWNAEAQAYHRGFLRVLIDRYGDRALVIQHNAFGDESPLPPAPTPHLFDAEALKDHVAKFGCEPEVTTRKPSGG